MEVRVVYINASQVIFDKACFVAENTTVKNALITSGVLETHPEASTLSFAIFSKPVSPDTILKDGDRIEIVRSLLIDPKERRRQKALRKKT